MNSETKSLANSFLFDAAKKGDVSAVERALNDGAEIDVRDILAETPLICAAKRGHQNVVEYLLSHGADVNSKSRPAARSMTALMWSAENGFLNVVNLLIKAGADVSARNLEGKTACDLAKHFRHREIEQMLSVQKKI